MRRREAMEATASYYADEYAKEWQRKGALETRALAVGTAVVALTTLLAGWIDRLHALDDLSHGCALVAMIAAAALGGLSLALALFAAILFKFKSPSIDAMERLVMAIDNGDDPLVHREIAKTLIGQLKAGRAANQRKYRCLWWATSLLLFALSLASATLVVALNS